MKWDKSKGSVKDKELVNKKIKTAFNKVRTCDLKVIGARFYVGSVFRETWEKRMKSKVRV